MAFRLTPQRKPKLSENDVEKASLDTLALRGWLAVRQQVGLLYTRDGRPFPVGTPGDPDYLVVHRKYPAFYLETKAPDGKLSPAQIKRHWEITQAFRIPVCTANCVEQLIRWLDAYEAQHS